MGLYQAMASTSAAVSGIGPIANPGCVLSAQVDCRLAFDPGTELALCPR